MKKIIPRGTSEFFAEAYVFLLVVSGIIAGTILILMMAAMIIVIINESFYAPLMFVALTVFYFVATSFWKKREFTLETGNWFERFLVRKAGAFIDFIPFVTYKTLLGVALVSIAPSLANVDSLVLALFQIIAGILLLPLIKYRFVGDKFGHFDICYAVDPINKKISINGLFLLNSMLVGLFGFGYFGILIATIQKTYGFTVITPGNG
jgi:hypothetical protein